MVTTRSGRQAPNSVEISISRSPRRGTSSYERQQGREDLGNGSLSDVSPPAVNPPMVNAGVTRTPFKIDLPVFRGTVGEDIQVWLNKLDTCFLYYSELTSYQRVILAATRLEGPAAIFWDEFRLRPCFDCLNSDPDAFGLFSKAIKERFLPLGWEQGLYDQFDRTSHRTSVEQFASRLQHLATQLNLPDHQLRQRFIAGLQPYYQERVREQVPQTFAAAVNVAKAIESVAPARHVTDQRWKGGKPAAPPWNRRPKNKISGNKSNLECFNCGKRGHKAFECRAPKKMRINAVSTTLHREAREEPGEGGPGQR